MNLVFFYFFVFILYPIKVREKFKKCSVDEISKDSRLSLHESMLPAEIDCQRDATLNIPDHTELHESQRVNTMRKKKPKNVSDSLIQRLSEVLNIFINYTENIFYKILKLLLTIADNKIFLVRPHPENVCKLR